MKFNSLRRRIAAFYALLLLGVILAVGLVLTFELRSILLDSARAAVDRVGNDIAAVVRGNGTGSFGDTLPIDQELTLPGNLDRWSSPTTYVEVDNAAGQPEGKSSNMGGMTFAPSPPKRTAPVTYSEQATPVGKVLVRDEAISFPGVALTVKVGESLQAYDETLARARTLLAIVMILATVAVVAGSVAIASSAVEPIEALSSAMREISSERLDRRLGPSTRTDELGRLAASFDDMLDRLEAGFARERQFISDASHELKTPLTVINANAQMLERWAERDPTIRAESLRAIRDESASLANMINGMLLLAKAETGDGIPREPVDLASVVVEAVKLERAHAEAKGLALTLEGEVADGARVVGDANLLRQVFTNLLENAIKFSEQGTISIELSSRDGQATVVVADTGIGIEEEALERVFDRFYRADKSRNRQIEGTGLGLAIVRSIVRIHGGTVSAERRPEGGTAFRVTLPTLTSLS
ncbi:MAG TPA: HAMP domain-containing sensor histidine kinase [Candidatus Baltobacteraceae bacterium]|nr:HAMP domain-containing sensor histidine kinase [Candidatus Baltobacteraceae bacterium]